MKPKNSRNAKHTKVSWNLTAISDAQGKPFGWGINGSSDFNPMCPGRIVDVPRIVVNHTPETQEFNARFIIEAVNSHEKMLTALMDIAALASFLKAHPSSAVQDTGRKICGLIDGIIGKSNIQT